MVGRRTIGIVPEQIAESGGGRAYIGVRVVAVDSPGLESALHDEVVAGAADVVHDFFAAIFLKRFADARAESFEHLIPRSARPLPAAARAGSLHWIKDAIGIVNLRNRGRALGTQAPAAGWMFWIAFELGDLPGFFVDVGEKPARRFAVEANRRNELVMFLDTARPGRGIELDPIIPLVDWRTCGKMAAVALKICHPRISIRQSRRRIRNLAVGHALSGHHEAPFKNQKSKQNEHADESSHDAVWHHEEQSGAQQKQQRKYSARHD